MKVIYEFDKDEVAHDLKIFQQSWEMHRALWDFLINRKHDLNAIHETHGVDYANGYEKAMSDLWGLLKEYDVRLD